MKSKKASLLSIAIVAMLGLVSEAHAVSTIFVTNGLPLNVVYNPTNSPWSSNNPGYLEQTGTGLYLFGTGTAGPNNFHIRSQLSLNINATAAAFTFNTDSHFGFDSGSKALFYEGPLLGTATVSLVPATNYIQSGVPFNFEVVRAGTNVSFLINGTNVFTYTKFTTNDPGQVGFRPWRATMDLYSFSIDQPLLIANLQPAPGAPSLFYPASGGLSFTVQSDAGVATNAVVVVLNGQNVSGQLQFTGNSNNWNVALPALANNVSYTGQITVTDASGLVVTQAVALDTFTQNIQFVEGEDYDFGGGQFIDNVVLSSSPAPNNYLDQQAIQGVDANMVTTPSQTLYRIGDIASTGISGDITRSNFAAAEAIDPGIADYFLESLVPDDWLNYTRTISQGYYNIYARVAKTGTPTFTAGLGVVTSGVGTTTQTVSPIGYFNGPATSGAQVYEFVELTDAFGNPVAVPLNGVTTLRFTPLYGSTLLNLNYFALVPQSSVTQPPYVAAVSPAIGSSNVITTPAVGANIVNGSTTVTTASIKLALDGTDVTGSSTVTPSAQGAQISYQVGTPLSLGVHQATLTYTDSGAHKFTNQWTFVAANQNVYGFWQFLEGTPGAHTSTNAGAILDSSGNSRNGSATSTNMTYVAGSASFGGTPALHFSASADFVSVPDPGGVFNFRGSLTFEAVVRTTNTATTPAILSKNNTVAGQGEYWWRAPGTAGHNQRLALKDDRSSADSIVAGTNALNDGQWHHLAAVYDTNASEIRLYLDYNLDAVTDNINLKGIIGFTSSLSLGNFVAGGDSFGGDINFIRISAGALTPSQFIHPTSALLPYITVTSPSPGALSVFPGSLVQATIVNRTTSATLSTLSLKLDGTSIPTNQIAITTNSQGAARSWPLPGNLAAGTHTLLVSVLDNGGPPTLITNSWSFAIPVNPLVRGFWQFDEQSPNGGFANSAPGVIVDRSGNGRNFTAFGNPTPQYVPSSGVYGSPGALHFAAGNLDAVRAGSNLAPAFNFSSSDSFTLEADIRINPAGSTSSQSIVSKDWGSALSAWWFRANTSILQFLIEDSTTLSEAVGSTPINDGNWHHVAAVRDGVNRTLSVYVDYQLDGTATDKTTGDIANDQDVSIGAFNLVEPGRDFLGDIDFVRISSAALTPDQFLQPGPPVPFDATASSGQFQFQFQSTPGVNYVVEQTPSLTPPNWTVTNTLSGDGTVFTNVFPLNGQSSFYRVRLQ